MKLRSKAHHVKPVPGQIREKICFAWWPKHVEDKVIWLEKYKKIEKMSDQPRIVFVGKYPIMAPWGWDFVETKLMK